MSILSYLSNKSGQFPLGSSSDRAQAIFRCSTTLQSGRTAASDLKHLFRRLAGPRADDNWLQRQMRRIRRPARASAEGSRGLSTIDRPRPMLNISGCVDRSVWPPSATDRSISRETIGLSSLARARMALSGPTIQLPQARSPPRRLAMTTNAPAAMAAIRVATSQRECSPVARGATFVRRAPWVNATARDRSPMRSKLMSTRQPREATFRRVLPKKIANNMRTWFEIAPPNG